MSILSAITTLGSMTFAQFNQSVRIFYADQGDFLVWKLRRDLTALGHIESDFMRGNIRACSPRLCLLPEPVDEGVSAVLAGARNEAILNKFSEQAVLNRFQIYSTKNNQFVPDRLEIKGRYEDLCELAKQMVDPCWSIGSNWNMPDAWVLLHDVTSLADRLKRHLACRAPAGAGSGSDLWVVFDPQKALFLSWSKIKKDYPWKLMLIRRSPYLHWLALKKKDGTWQFWQHCFEGDPLWAKWGVAQSSEEQDPFSGSDSVNFSVPVWLPLPVELHRVCCLCTGMLPEEKNQRIIYKGVPTLIQQIVKKKLCLETSLSA